eukprot:13782552-Alexandrium_andersonii.AAC.1
MPGRAVAGGHRAPRCPAGARGAARAGGGQHLGGPWPRRAQAEPTGSASGLSLIHISEPTRLALI